MPDNRVKNPEKFWRSAALLLGGLLIGFFSFYLIDGQSRHSDAFKPKHGQELRNINFASAPLINPLLACDDIGSVSDMASIKMYEKINGYLEKQKAEGVIEHAAVYYRDLNNGPWFGIDENATFWPASLLKVPVLISALKYSIDNKEFLSQSVTFEVSKNIQTNILADHSLEIGKKYSNQELLEYMIRYSDNEALAILRTDIPATYRNSVYKDLGIVEPESNDYSMTVKMFATFFRVLYNATYLPPDLSAKALQLLSEVQYKDGLVAGVEPGTVVAHKFGERLNVATGTRQLHDCGIVYFPKQPYLLCIMSSGDDFDSLTKIISHISNIVYEATAEEAADAQKSRE